MNMSIYACLTRQGGLLQSRTTKRAQGSATLMLKFKAHPPPSHQDFLVGAEALQPSPFPQTAVAAVGVAAVAVALTAVAPLFCLQLLSAIKCQHNQYDD